MVVVIRVMLCMFLVVVVFMKMLFNWKYYMVINGEIIV